MFKILNVHSDDYSTIDTYKLMFWFRYIFECVEIIRLVVFDSSC